MRILPVIALSLLCATAAHAQGTADWKFQASIYAWLPSVGGSTIFPPGGGSGSSEVAIDSGTVLDHFNAAFMGSFAAQRGPWGMYTDLIYLDFTGGKSASGALTVGGVVPIGASADIDHELKGWLWTLAGTWRASSTPGLELDLLAGARMLDVQQHLSWNFSGNIGSIALQDRSGARESDARNWDAIIGVRGRAALGASRWFVPFYADMGTGDSDFTWQAMTGVGYAFGWGDVVGAWRHVDYKMKSGQPLQSINFDGPSIAAVFRW